MSDYVPARDADFDKWLVNLVEYVISMTAGATVAWPDIPERAVDGLVAAKDDWWGHYSHTLHPHTPAQTAAKNDARARVERAVRLFVRQYLHFDPVTNADRVNMGVPNHDTIPTTHLEVTLAVEFELVLRHVHEILVGFWVKGSSSRAKPQGYDGAVLIWAALDEPHPQRPRVFRGRARQDGVCGGGVAERPRHSRPVERDSKRDRSVSGMRGARIARPSTRCSFWRKIPSQLKQNAVSRHI